LSKRIEKRNGAPPYVPLWVKSNYSFLEGASHPEELIDRAHAHGLPAMALTDRDGFYGSVRAFVRAKELMEAHAGAPAEVHPPRMILGAQVSVEMERGITPLVLLAEDRRGYGEICQLLSKAHARAEQKGDARATLELVRTHASGVIALPSDAAMLEALAESHASRLYALVARHFEPEEKESEAKLRSMALRVGVETVATVEVLFHDRSRKALSDVLTCIRHGVTLRAAGRLLRQNAEHELVTPAGMARRFKDDLLSVARTLEVAERCTFELGQLRYRYPEEKLPEGFTEKSYLRTLTYEGARVRYPMGIPDEARAQIEKELELVEDLEYGGYFLTMQDVVRACKELNILCQGRGSAANSIVCYCLGITAVDPVRGDLLFERFLSRERAEPPDIDLDIEHERREEVIQYVYERWGRRHSAMVANFIRYRLKSAVRDVGKVLDLPELALDRASKILSRRESIDDDVIREAGLDPKSASTSHLLVLVSQIQDYPRHLSIHPGGFLLGHEPVDTLVPIENATMEKRTVVQWDKQDIEDLGLFKVDLLGLGILSVIHRAFDTLKEHEEIALEIATVPAEDATTYAMVSRGETVGVFQIESRAQMAMLPRLRPRTFYDLVIEVAIVRPGPIQGDMVHPYLRRREGLEPVAFPHPKLERVLGKTLGVPIFQEQVMKLAVAVAGYTPGEADQLRRDMAAWRSKGRIEKHREKLVTRMVEDGIPLEFAERVYKQIQGFGEYGFPESHAASFALLAYVTAWLRCHHPAHFACALLNAWPMGFYHPSTIVDDVKRRGVAVLPIDVRKSAWECTLEAVSKRGWGIRMGLRYVKGLGKREEEALARERVLNEAGEVVSPFRSIAEFVRRMRLSRRALESIAQAGAFDSFGPSGSAEPMDRRAALWEIARLSREEPGGFALDERPRAKKTRFRALSAPETIGWDYRTSLHSARGHPMEGLRPLCEDRGIPEARTVSRMKNGTRVRVAGLVICRQRPGTATGVTFLTLEDETGFVNIVCWRDVFERFELVGKTAAILEVRGRIQSEMNVVHVVAEELFDLGAEITRARVLGETSSTDLEKSRDFH
jgi:error-prone DNA polymerase